MTDSNLVQLKTPTEDALGDLLKQGAQQLLARAIEAEVDALLSQHGAQRIEGKRAVVHNGFLPEWTIQIGHWENDQHLTQTEPIFKLCLRKVWYWQ